MISLSLTVSIPHIFQKGKHTVKLISMDIKLIDTVQVQQEASHTEDLTQLWIPFNCSVMQNSCCHNLNQSDVPIFTSPSAKLMYYSFVLITFTRVYLHEHHTFLGSMIVSQYGHFAGDIVALIIFKEAKISSLSFWSHNICRMPISFSVIAQIFRTSI